jgi:hypothetical protein
MRNGLAASTCFAFLIFFPTFEIHWHFSHGPWRFRPAEKNRSSATSGSVPAAAEMSCQIIPYFLSHNLLLTL